MESKGGLLFFAIVAALGNAAFVYAQKRALPIQSLFFFIGVAAFVCCACNLVAGFVTGANVRGVPQVFTNGRELAWAIFGGVALFITYYGMNNLFVRYGAMTYALYAVISIFSTSILVGVLLLKEKMNVYHVAGTLCTIASVVLFTLGNNKK
ncbi:MAG: EamA family transporter [Sphaerochaetaceae bacterium]|nr:EamA family transporter [Sphaerochaetaceae bacterium]